MPHFFRVQGPFIALANARQCLFCRTVFFRVFYFLESGFANMETLAAAGALREALESGGDFFRQLDPQPGVLLLTTTLDAIVGTSPYGIGRAGCGKRLPCVLGS